MSRRLPDAAFGKLLAKAAKHAARSSEIQQALTDAFNARYGATYSDVDADGLIDALDYGGGNAPTVQEADHEMTRCGKPPVTEATP